LKKEVVLLKNRNNKRKIVLTALVFASILIICSYLSYAVVDSDFDGVLDNNDQCPETDFGDVVDRNGCSCSQKIEQELCTDDGNPCTDICGGPDASCNFPREGECGDDVECPEDYCVNYVLYDFPGSGRGVCRYGTCEENTCAPEVMPVSVCPEGAEEEPGSDWTCEDSTPHGQCSRTRPWYCRWGELIKNSIACGCAGTDSASLSGDCITCSDMNENQCNSNSQCIAEYEIDFLFFKRFVACHPMPVCGDGFCTFGETIENCLQDCEEEEIVEDYCGDGTCDPEEDSENCPEDCEEEEEEPEIMMYAEQGYVEKTGVIHYYEESDLVTIDTARIVNENNDGIQGDYCLAGDLHEELAGFRRSVIRIRGEITEDSCDAGLTIDVERIVNVDRLGEVSYENNNLFVNAIIGNDEDRNMLITALDNPQNNLITGNAIVDELVEDDFELVERNIFAGSSSLFYARLPDVAYEPETEQYCLLELDDMDRDDLMSVLGTKIKFIGNIVWDQDCGLAIEVGSIIGWPCMLTSAAWELPESTKHMVAQRIMDAGQDEQNILLERFGMTLADANAVLSQVDEEQEDPDQEENDIPDRRSKELASIPDRNSVELVVKGKHCEGEKGYFNIKYDDLNTPKSADDIGSAVFKDNTARFRWQAEHTPSYCVSDNACNVGNNIIEVPQNLVGRNCDDDSCILAYSELRELRRTPLEISDIDDVVSSFNPGGGQITFAAQDNELYAYNEDEGWYDIDGGREDLPLSIVLHSENRYNLDKGTFIDVYLDDDSVIRVAMPVLLLDEDDDEIELYISADGSTYYDAGLTQLAQASEALCDISTPCNPHAYFNINVHGSMFDRKYVDSISSGNLEIIGEQAEEIDSIYMPILYRESAPDDLNVLEI